MSLAADYGLTFPQQFNAEGFFEYTDDIKLLVRSSILQILGTKIGERYMVPTFGSRLPELIFEPLDEVVVSLARVYTIEAIKQWEPRVELNSVEVILGVDTMDFTIIPNYVITNKKIPDSIAVSLPRVVGGVS